MPKCPFHNNHMDGAMNFTIRDEEVRLAGSRCSGVLFIPVVSGLHFWKLPKTGVGSAPSFSLNTMTSSCRRCHMIRSSYSHKMLVYLHNLH